MENLTQIAKQRAERLKDHKYTTPLPFDVLATRQLPNSVAIAHRTAPNHTCDQNRSNEHYNDNRNKSSQLHTSTDSNSHSDSRRGSTDTQRYVGQPKHVPLYQFVDFRVSHSQQPSSQSARRRTSIDSQPESQACPSDLAQQESPKRIIRDGVPHLMTRHSTVMVESVEGVPLTATCGSSSIPKSTIPIPETDAEEVQDAERLTEADDLNLEAEFEEYQRHYARAPSGVGQDLNQDEMVSNRPTGRGRVPEVETAPWTKQGWEKRTMQKSPGPVNQSVASTHVPGYGTARAVAEQNKGDGRRDWASSPGRGALKYRTAEIPGGIQAAPMSTIPQLPK